MIIGKYSGAKSDYVPYICFGHGSHEKLNRDYIKPLVDKFFKAKGISNHNYKELNQKQIISNIDFCKVPINYFYEQIIGDISKNKDGKIKHKIKYAITFDKDLTPYSEDGILYGEIRLGVTPIFYYIYIDFQDMLKFLKERSDKNSIVF